MAQDEQSAVGVEEITVTAQRRTESAQDVPLSVSVVSAGTAAAMGVTDTSSLQAAVPGLEFTRSLNNATPALRGIGTNPAAPAGDEAAVATYVDGVYITSPAAALFSFNNIQQIEVLKGPQGTLFGRNATGGVVQIITRDPSHTPSADLEVGYGNYDTATTNFYGTMGLADSLAFDFALHYEDQAEGWGTNLTSGQDIFTNNEFGVRSKWLFTPSDQTRITFSADYTRTRGNTGAAGRALPGGVVGAPHVNPFTGLPDPQPDDELTSFSSFYDVYGNLNSGSDTIQRGASLKIEQDLDWARLVSISSYREVDSDVIYDGDKTGDDEQDYYINSTGITRTQEFQLLSPTGSPIEWIAGLYYFHDFAKFDPLQQRGDVAAPLYAGNVYNEQETFSYAAFGQATANLGENTRLTLGLRYTEDEREQYGYILGDFGAGDPVLFPPGVLTGESSFDDLTYRVALDHRFSPDFLGYVSFNTGFKSGLYNLVAPGSPAVEPEELDAYEIGFKSDWFDNRFRLNVAAFHYDFTNLQVSLLQSSTTTLVNAAESESQGIDVDFQWVPTSNFRLIGAVSYVDATFTDYPDGQITTPNPGLVPCTPGGSATPNCVTTGDVTGNRVPRSPEWAGNLTGQYTIPTSSGDFLLSLSYYYNAGYPWEPDNRVEQPDYNLLSASIGWESNTTGLSFRLWGKNLLEEEYYAYVSSSEVGDVGFVAPPMTFGATVGYSW